MLPLNTAFFDSTESSRAATAKNQDGYLMKLLEHQDDPLYWLGSCPEPSSGSATPMLIATPKRQPEHTDPHPPQLHDIPHMSSPHSSPPTLAPVACHPSRTLNLTTSVLLKSAPAPASLLSPLLPPLPSRSSPSPPLPTRLRSHTSLSLPSRWVSSLLSACVGPQYHASLPAGIGADAGITHGSPFAPHEFVPPSGARGFAGDRAWSKGFEFDSARVEQGSVALVGRRESTNVVLTKSLANEVRQPSHPLFLVRGCLLYHVLACLLSHIS